MSVDGSLLFEVREYLNITWADDKTDRKITGIIKRGMAYLQEVAGVSSLDFSVEDSPKSLLLDYARYANSHALEMFPINFRGELLSLHLKYQAQAVGGVVVNENQNT